MGGDLPEPKAGAPSFLVWAASDPSGPNLDRVQVVKGWARNGQSFEKVYDVVWSGDRKPDPTTGKVSPIASTVDIKKGRYENTIGSKELKASWTDPNFDPGIDAFYYVRALSIATPRWTTIQSATLGEAPPTVVPQTVQDRAWSSPIWYTPSAEARRAATPGMTLADLERKGAVPLDDAQLTAKIVGSTVRMLNVVTRQRFEIFYDAAGHQRVASVDGKALPVGVPREARFAPELPYEIRGGQIVTTVGGTPFSLAVYKLGDKFVASQSDEYEFANYEMEF